MRKILDFLNAGYGHGWLIAGSLVIFFLLVWADHVRAGVYALPGHEVASFECRQQAEGVRSVAESRDQGGSIGSWLNVSPAQAWADLVVYIWDHPGTPSDLFALSYGQCMAGRWHRDPA